MIRRKLYTEHKYVSFRLSEFSRFIAKTDFSDNHSTEAVITREIKELMHGHAGHENNTIHPLLKDKGSALWPVYAVMAVDHMICMLKELFPHFNREDKFGMLNDIHLAQPDKFSKLWQECRSFLEKNDHSYLTSKFGIPSVFHTMQQVCACQ